MARMRVLLAAAPHADTFGYAMPPPGLLRLGGELLRRGVPVALEDLPHRLAAGALPRDERLAEAAAQRLSSVPCDVLGLSVMGATTPIALAIARRVRAAAGERPLIVLGGPGTTGIDAALVERFPWIDAVVRGEGEVTLPALLERWAAGAPLDGISGVTHRGPGGVGGAARREPDRPPLADLGDLPGYAWGLVPPFEEYRRLSGEGLVPIDSGRGCVFDCSFCTIGRFWGRRSRVLPVERLLDEVAAVRGIPGGERAYLCHDLFGVPREHALAFCRGMLARGIDVPWECRARLDHLDEELLALMARAGCYRVLLGVESASPAVRDGNGKQMGAATLPLEVVAACGRLGITPILSFLLGLPGEGEDELRASLDLARDAALRAGVNLSFHLPNPQPGCRLGEEHGAGSRPVEGLAPDMAFGAGETREERELIAAHPDLFGTWSLLTGVAGGEARLRELHALATDLPALLMARPRTFALLSRARGLDTHGLWSAWRASGLAFDAFAAGAGEPLVVESLRWEQAVEAAPAGARLVRTAQDPTRAARWLLGAGGWPPPAAGPARLAVVRGRRGVRTLRVSEDVARLIERSQEGPGTQDETARGLDPAERELLAALTLSSGDDPR